MYTDYNAKNTNLLNSSNGFKNNNLIFSQEIIFFYESTKFLWKELMKINSTYILKSKDISQLEPYVENILYSKLLPDDIDLLSNEYIVQLVTLLQLTGQYLVYTQKRLEYENQELKERINEMEYNYKDSEKMQGLIDSLNRQNQEKDFLIKTYQNMINSGYAQGLNMSGDNKNIIDNENNILKNKKDGYNESEKKLYFCKYCTGKKFKSQKYLDEHIQRRHFDQIDIDSEKDYQEARENFKEKQYKEIFERKLNSLREYCEKIFQQNNENTELNLINRKIDYLNDQLMSQNNLKINNNYNQNGLCINCHQNLNNIPQRNINNQKNGQRPTNNKEIENLNDKYNDLINNYTNFKSQILNQINTGKKDIQKYKLDNGKKSGEIMNNNNININTRQNIKNKTTYSNQNNVNNMNIKDKEVDINIEKINNIENKKVKNSNEFLKNDFITNEPKNQEKENNINENNINTNINNNNNNNNINEQKKTDIKLNLNNSNNEKEFTNKGDSEKDNKISSNKNDENKNTNQIDVFNSSINKNEIENRNVNITINDEINEKKLKDQNILKDKKLNDNENEKNGDNNIYEKEENLSANFGNKDKDKDKDKENGITELKENNENKEPNSLINSFEKKVKKRDNDFYNNSSYVNINPEDYEIKIPSQFKVKEEKINNKIDNKLKDKNIDDLGELVNDYENIKQKYIKGKEIYKILGLDDIIKNYKDYMQDKNIELKKSKSKNSKNEEEIKIENIKNSNEEAKIPLPNNSINHSVNTNMQNPYSRNDTNIQIDIKDNNNKNIIESSIDLLEQNFGDKNPKKMEQSIVIGHDLTKSVA